MPFSSDSSPSDDGTSLPSVLLLLCASLALLIAAFVLIIFLFRFAFAPTKGNKKKKEQKQKEKNGEEKAKGRPTAEQTDKEQSNQLVFHDISLADDSAAKRSADGKLPKIVLTTASMRVQRL